MIDYSYKHKSYIIYYNMDSDLNISSDTSDEDYVIVIVEFKKFL